MELCGCHGTRQALVRGRRFKAGKENDGLVLELDEDASHFLMGGTYYLGLYTENPAFGMCVFAL